MYRPVSYTHLGVGVFGALVAIKGGISVGRLSCFLSYANQYTKPFNEISGVVTELQNAFVCAGRIFELIDEEPQVPDAADARVLEAVSYTHLDVYKRQGTISLTGTAWRMVAIFGICVLLLRKTKLNPIWVMVLAGVMKVGISAMTNVL